jgi:curved DNA-binding protein CbpA
MLRPGNESLAAPEHNPFDVLGVRSEDTDRQMKDAWRKAAFATHPDRHPGDDEAARL